MAARKPDSPSRADGGVRHFMLVDLTTCRRNSLTSVMSVLTATLFSHSNSAHMARKVRSEHDAGEM